MPATPKKNNCLEIAQRTIRLNFVAVGLLSGLQRHVGPQVIEAQREVQARVRTRVEPDAV